MKADLLADSRPKSSRAGSERDSPYCDAHSMSVAPGSIGQAPFAGQQSGHQEVQRFAQLVNIEGLVEYDIHVHLGVGLANLGGKVSR